MNNATLGLVCSAFLFTSAVGAAEPAVRLTIAAERGLVRVSIENAGQTEVVLDLGWIGDGAAHSHYVQLFAGRSTSRGQSCTSAKPTIKPARTTPGMIRLPAGGRYGFDLAPEKYYAFAPDGTRMTLAEYLSQPSELRVQLNLRQQGALISNALRFPRRSLPAPRLAALSASPVAP